METLLCVRPCAIVLCILAVLFPGSSAQQQSRGVIYTDCLRNATSLATAFRSDLEAALRDFASLSARGTTYNTTTTDSLYATFQCRGDLSPASCSDCMQDATARLPQACPLSVGARLWMDGCFLRYDNQSFFHLDATGIVVLCNRVDTADSVALTAISDVMLEVLAEAPKSSDRFASANARDMYAIAECWRYLNESECSQCLQSIPYRQNCDSGLGQTLYMASCDYRYENYNFLDSTSPPPPPSSPATPPSSPPPQPSSSATPPPPSSGSKIWIVAVVFGVLGCVVAVCIVLAWRFRRASKLKGGQRLENTSSSRKFFTKARLFSLKELEEATSHFDPTNKLGEGGFGVVYKGTLMNGEKIAIKTLHRGSQRGKQEFLNEVNVITTVQHKNLIELIGCCVEGSERILVYKYIANKSLDLFLSGRDPRTLTWSNRFGIILGMAKGLAYLHEESQVSIIHRDIKPSNILLDDQLNPIIADFGLARLVQDEETHKITGVAGTIGYLSPEYVVHGALSQKVDVYSFGLVALEIVTGKQNMAGAILTWAWQAYEHGNVLELVDHRMRGVFSPDQVVRVVHVALLCTQENPKLRPLMSTIVLWLSGSSVILEIPIKPTFLDHYESDTPVSGLSQPMVSTPSTSSRSAIMASGGALSVSGVHPR